MKIYRIFVLILIILFVLFIAAFIGQAVTGTWDMRKWINTSTCEHEYENGVCIKCGAEKGPESDDEIYYEFVAFE